MLDGGIFQTIPIDRPKARSAMIIPDVGFLTLVIFS